MKENFHISTDKDLLDFNFIHDYMTKISYWGKGRTVQQTEKTIKNSLCFGMYTKSNKPMLKLSTKNLNRMLEMQKKVQALEL